VNRRGINHTDWCPKDKTTYDACVDTRDYRPKPSLPGADLLAVKQQLQVRRIGNRQAEGVVRRGGR
jgi:hypothetical protein